MRVDEAVGRCLRAGLRPERRRVVWLCLTGLLPPEERGWRGPPQCPSGPDVPRREPEAAVDMRGRKFPTACLGNEPWMPDRMTPTRGVSHHYWGDESGPSGSWDRVVRAYEDG